GDPSLGRCALRLEADDVHHRPGECAVAQGGREMRLPRSGEDDVQERADPGVLSRSVTRKALEMAGLYYEQFHVGQLFEHAIRRTVTEADNVFFTAMTHNPAALHLDEEYGKTTEFGSRIVNSMFTLGLM